MKRWLALSFFVASALVSRSGLAADCEPGGRPYIRLIARVAPPDEIIVRNLERHLRAELGERGIDVCSSTALAKGSIAEVGLVIEHPSPGAFDATIDIADAITDKRISRTIDLARLSPAARLMAVAASTDELLRASWTELQVADAPPPKMAPPAAVVAAVRASFVAPAKRTSDARPGWPPRLELGAALRASSYLGTPRQALGLALDVGYWVAPRLGLHAGASAARGFARDGLHGNVAADTYDVEVGTTYALAGRERRWGVDASLRAALGLVAYRASATTGEATNAVDWTMGVGASLAFWLRQGSARWMVGMGGLGALRPSVANDVGHGSVTGVDGIGAEVFLGARLAP